MWALLLVLGAAGVSAQQIYPVKVVPGGRMLSISAQPKDTVYDFTTNQHSRIIAVCTLDQSLDCESTMFQASLDGQTWKNVCNVTQRVQYLPSASNQLKLRIKTSKDIYPVQCQFSATKKYVGLHGKDQDSSEHGIEGLTKQKPTCRCGWANKKNGRIVGGQVAKENEFSFPVRMTVNGQPFCGGSIISPWHALTASHCTQNMQGNKVAIVVGEHNITNPPESSIYTVAKIVTHELYDPVLAINDITILVLERKIEFTDLIGPVCMPRDTSNNLVGDYVKILGWGNTSPGGYQSDVLKKLDLNVLDPEICNVIYPNFNNNGQTLCTYRDKESSCQGDSGGPLVWRSPNTNMFVQAALVSYGIICASKDPTVNTDVSHYMSWITRVVNETSPEVTEMCYSN